MNHNEPELFKLSTVEQVTGVRAATVRKWKQLGVYECEIFRRLKGPRIISAPDHGREKREAAVRSLAGTGWVRYSIGDMIRILTLWKLSACIGVALPVASRAVYSISTPESDRHSVPNGRELIRMRDLVDVQIPDEMLVVSSQGHVLQTRNADKFLDGIDEATIEFRGEGLPVSHGVGVLNLSAVRREVLWGLEKVKPTLTSDSEIEARVED